MFLEEQCAVSVVEPLAERNKKFENELSMVKCVN
jgi:hypothetical protein